MMTALFVDQVAKILIVKSLALFNPPTEIIGSLLRFKLTYNQHGVFGISFGPNILYYVLSLVGAMVLIYIGLSLKDKTGVIIFGFIIGGAVGNVLDRIRLDYVVDFIDMGIGNSRWFTYNLADAFITVGAVFLLTRELFHKKPANTANP